MRQDLRAKNSTIPIEPRRHFVEAATLCLLVGLAWAAPATARGGFHGMGNFGFHGGGRMGRGDLVAAPAYVLIAVSSIADADAFKKMLQDLVAATAPFSGRLAVDSEKPASWEGTAPEQIVMVQFTSADQAQAWKNSDAFKSFDAELHRSSASTMQLVQGLPVPVAKGRRGGARLDAKAFELNVKDYDRLLDQQLKSICKGC